MKIQALFDILQDAQDVLSYFENVTDKDQMVSRLDRLRRQDPDELLDTIEALRVSTNTALEDHLELGGTLGETQDDDGNLLENLENMTEASVFDENSEPGLSNPTSEENLKEKVSS
jgi:hypothetical protein